MTEATVETLWDRNGETPYQTRVKCGAFRIHIFWRGDRDPDMHDHPADFWTFPLVSYVEEVGDYRGELMGWRIVKAFRFHRRKAEFAHRVLGAWDGIVEYRDGVQFFGTDKRPIITLGWWGKKRREWGFHTRGNQDEWTPWREYVNQPGWK